ncbi:DinB family protein [Propioniciclava coleopterorum]|uniref:DinB family protein n=1 Tax=Propioniciclava coleopterorum TaxID=2714937 RepID=A0A6G7Y3V8_9ACTN|nr:DinB family protein [Propioniciclava coleopterorum]QIK71297.1 DinB family protein [Propioniciclava coleopterorum]
MDANALLIDAIGRPLQAARAVLRDLDADAFTTLVQGPVGRGNSIAWLVWHAARQQDAQMADLSGAQQQWVTGGWAERLGVSRGPGSMGFGDTEQQVADLHVSDPADLLAYVTAVTDASVEYLRGLSSDDLAEVVDHNWTPPVTRGVRIISVIDDATAHVAQAEYARGLLTDWSIGY